MFRTNVWLNQAVETVYKKSSERNIVILIFLKIRRTSFQITQKHKMGWTSILWKKFRDVKLVLYRDRLVSLTKHFGTWIRLQATTVQNYIITIQWKILTQSKKAYAKNYRLKFSFHLSFDLNTWNQRTLYYYWISSTVKQIKTGLILSESNKRNSSPTFTRTFCRTPALHWV